MVFIKLHRLKVARHSTNPTRLDTHRVLQAGTEVFIDLDLLSAEKFAYLFDACKPANIDVAASKRRRTD